MKEPIIVMMRVGEEKYKDRHVIECTYTEVEDGESVLDAETNHEVSMRITGPALLGLWDSIEEECDRRELKASCYKLRPCPFCGSRSIQIFDHEERFQKRYMAFCKGCGAEMWDDDDIQLVRKWNTRMSSTCSHKDTS